MVLPERVTLIEVGPRDGFQSEQKLIPTELKVELIGQLADAGLTEIQICSFVHPARVPQMADAEEVVRRVARRPGVTYSGLVLNGRGVERAAAAGLGAVDLSISASDTHCRKNANRSLEEARADLQLMIRAARSKNLRTRVGLQCAFGCAYEGAIPLDRVVEMSREIVEEGAAALSLADHEMRRRARVVVELAPVPPVLANESRLSQLFLNLLVNAAQAIPEGHADRNEIRVTVRADEAGRVQVAVRDTGSGIAPEHRKRLFDPFFTTKPSGLGLGLSISRSIVEAHGGAIRVSAAEGGGAVFHVLLPAAAEPQGATG